MIQTLEMLKRMVKSSSEMAGLDNDEKFLCRKMMEEASELMNADLNQEDSELGDLFVAILRFCAATGKSPDDIVLSGCHKFVSRCMKVCDIAKIMPGLSKEELWQHVKRLEKGESMLTLEQEYTALVNS